MLGNHPIDVVLLATDLEESKQFYAGKLGLEILHESEARSPTSAALTASSRSLRAPRARPTSRPRRAGA
jgi:catechol 2,3-dioxygenase-like lactoylglutathione lyase family enzyme